MSATDLASARLDALDAFLLELNQTSAKVIEPLFRAQHGLENKAGPGDFDPVTKADKGAEAAIRALIAQRFPEHGVIGEEYGQDRPDAEFVWVLDPIDGTRAFIAGLPVWTTLIGLRHQGHAVLGSIGQPYIGEIFIGDARGSRLVTSGGARPLRVRACSTLDQAIVATTDPVLFKDGQDEAWRRLRAAVRLARLGCDAYAYAMVAAGCLDLVVETGLKPWDIEAAIPVLAGAGGYVTDWRGTTIGTQGGQMLIGGDRAALDQAVEILKPAAL
ncbi:MAG TPA: histidinol-phosphatase [Caulobacteraceae bacterium]|jgi:histidinol phosphatase-like enzyme (inositol monophosphatase family)